MPVVVPDVVPDVVVPVVEPEVVPLVEPSMAPELLGDSAPLMVPIESALMLESVPLAPEPVASPPVVVVVFLLSQEPSSPAPSTIAANTNAGFLIRIIRKGWFTYPYGH